MQRIIATVRLTIEVPDQFDALDMRRVLDGVETRCTFGRLTEMGLDTGVVVTYATITRWHGGPQAPTNPVDGCASQDAAHIREYHSAE